jgi:hypothetical protein
MKGRVDGWTGGRVDGNGGKVGLIRVRGLFGRALAPQNYEDSRQKDARQPCILPMDAPERNP